MLSVCACVRACVRVCVRACVRAWCIYAYVCIRAFISACMVGVVCMCVCVIGV